jgi:hypothetical protein
MRGKITIENRPDVPRIASLIRTNEQDSEQRPDVAPELLKWFRNGVTDLNRLYGRAEAGN